MCESNIKSMQCVSVISNSSSFNDPNQIFFLGSQIPGSTTGKGCFQWPNKKSEPGGAKLS